MFKKLTVAVFAMALSFSAHAAQTKSTKGNMKTCPLKASQDSKGLFSKTNPGQSNYDRVAERIVSPGNSSTTR